MPIIDGSTITTLEPVPAGTYEAQLASYEIKAGKKGPYYSCIYELTEGEFVGRKMYDNLSLASQSLWVFKSTAMALGEDEDTFAGEFDSDVVLDNCLGHPCRLDITVGDYKGKAKNDVEKVRAPGFD